MNSLIMLKMALKQLKEYSSNEWVIEDGKRYNIDLTLSRIEVAEKDFINFKGHMPDSNFKLYDYCEVEDETYSQQMQNDLEPIGEPFDSKIKLYHDLGIASSGYYEGYTNHLPRLVGGLEDSPNNTTVEGGVITHIGGVPVNWTFHTTDDDCEFENE